MAVGQICKVHVGCHGDVSNLGIPKSTRHCPFDLKPQNFQERHFEIHPHDLVFHQTRRVHGLAVKLTNLFLFPTYTVDVKFLFCVLLIPILVLDVLLD